MAFFLIVLIIGGLLGYFVGSKRYIGLGWTLFFCLTGSVLLSLPIIFSSNLKTKPPREYSQTQSIFGWISLAIGVIFLFSLISIGSSTNLSSLPPRAYESIGSAFSISVFVIGLGIYLLQSNSFNKSYYSNSSNVNSNTTNQNSKQNVSTPSVSTVQQPNNIPDVEYDGGHNRTPTVNVSPRTPTPPPTTTVEKKSTEFNDDSDLYGKI